MFIISKNDIQGKKISFDLDSIDLEKYKSTIITKDGLDERSFATKKEFVSEENRSMSKYEICFEIARYLNRSPIFIEKLLNESGQFDEVADLVSKYNEILYDVIIPGVFNFLYTITDEKKNVKKAVPLIQYRKGQDHFNFNCDKGLTIDMDDPLVRQNKNKSFHTDRYCFDSKPELKLFLDLINRDDINEVYFTGMFTGSENGLSIQYIDPDSHIIRNYYPDFLVYRNGSSEVDIVEVKGDNRIDAPEVKAKASAAEEMTALIQDYVNYLYKMIPSSEIMSGEYEKERK